MTRSSALDPKYKTCGFSLRTSLSEDVSTRNRAYHHTVLHPHLIVLQHDPHCRTIEAYTDGDDRRAHALAILAEIPVGALSVTPFRLQEICGPLIPWTKPRPGEAIVTVFPILSVDEAFQVLSTWAGWTFAHNATLHR
jgi:hypothetical protein